MSVEDGEIWYDPDDGSWSDDGGKISNLQKKTATVKKGQEKGNFEFGGSTVILLLQPGKVRIDYDLLDNTEEGYETIVKWGNVSENVKSKKALRFVKNS